MKALKIDLPVVLGRQANIAQGPQQLDNGMRRASVNCNGVGWQSQGRGVVPALGRVTNPVRYGA